MTDCLGLMLLEKQPIFPPVGACPVDGATSFQDALLVEFLVRITIELMVQDFRMAMSSWEGHPNF